jgi:hypothetical protein
LVSPEWAVVEAFKGATETFTGQCQKPIESAYLFTFSIIMATQMSRIKLAPRFMVPVAFLMTTRFLETGRAKQLCIFCAACAFQIYYISGSSRFAFVVVLLPLAVPYYQAQQEIGGKS